MKVLLMTKPNNSYLLWAKTQPPNADLPRRCYRPWAAVFDAVYGSAKICPKWTKVSSHCGVSLQLPSRHFCSFMVKVNGLQTSQKVLLKLNRAPTTARVDMMTVPNHKATQNHQATQSETGHYNTQITSFDPEVRSPHRKTGVGTWFGIN